MSKNNRWLPFAITALVVALLPLTAAAQSYSVIDGDLGLYCADLPDGTNALVRVTNKKGLINTLPVDPKSEIETILKLRKNLQKRVNALNSIKRDYDPSKQTKLRAIYRFVASEIVNDLDSDGSLDKTKPGQIFRKIGALVAQLKNKIADYDFALETIDRCLKNEDLIPPPQPISAEIIVFPFTHPDYGTLEVMRGLGVTAILPKKRITGQLCVSVSKPHIRLSVFPKESIVTVTRNPCLLFFQTSFRNFPFCHYGANEHSAVGWFGSTDVGFSGREVNASELQSLERKLAHYAPVSVRAPTKKNPCRTGK